jgi:hypothetical protein
MARKEPSKGEEAKWAHNPFNASYNFSQMGSAHSTCLVRLCYPLLNSLGGGEARVHSRSASLALIRTPLVTTLDLEMAILGEKRQDLEEAFCGDDYLFLTKT